MYDRRNSGDLGFPAWCWGHCIHVSSIPRIFNAKCTYVDSSTTRQFPLRFVSPALKKDLATRQRQLSEPVVDREVGVTSQKTESPMPSSSDSVDGGYPEIQQPHQPPLPVVLRLRALGWSGAGNRSNTEIGDFIASVALDLSVVQDSHRRDHGDRYPGEQEHYANDYWLFASFDDGAVRLWQVRVNRKVGRPKSCCSPERIEHGR